MWLISSVDDGSRPSGGRGDGLPDEFRPLREAVDGAFGGVENLSRSGVDLAGHEEGNEDCGGSRKIFLALGEIVLMAAIGVAHRVGVVLEQEDLALDPFFVQAFLRPLDEVSEDPLPCFVVGH